MKSIRFCGLDKEFSDYDKSKYVVIPANYEVSSTYGKGSVDGPYAIIEASGNMELYDEEMDFNVCEKGIHTMKFLDKGANLDDIEKKVDKVLCDGKFPIVVGGEHTVALPAIKSVKKAFGNFSILHIDAHADLRDDFEGDKMNHACVMRRAFEVKENIVSLGVRSMCEEEKEFVLENKDKITLFFGKDIVSNSISIKRILEKLSDKVYISLDFDGFDPSVIPATGTPEPGGIGYYQMLDILREVFAKKNVVGMDVSEIAPIKGLSFPQYTAAKTIYKMITYKEYYSK